MSWFTGIAAYVVIWWIALFTVLPWGVRPPDEPEPGMAPSAPEKPRLWIKAGVTTVLAAALWGLLYVAVEYGMISFRDAAGT